MKTLNEKAKEFAARLSNQSCNFSKGEMETAYVIGASENNWLTNGELGTFSQALESIKTGRLVTRREWDSKGIFIFMRPEDRLPIDFVSKEIKSLPIDVKNYYAQDLKCKSENPEEDVVKFPSYLCMKEADGTIVHGWIASQTDMLADDWMIFSFRY